jgi:ribonucleoside-diphosphate reductase alpha chain
MKLIRTEAEAASRALAETRGPFPNFENSIFATETPHLGKLRNATLTTIAPTGTLSIIANCSSSIEPLFAVCYVRCVLDQDELIELNPLFEDIAKREGFYSEALIRKLAVSGTVQELEEIPEHIRRLFITARELAPEWHVKMQAVFQRYVDNGVAKTINFPRHATVADVERAYMLAYQSGCKGITIYREGSRKHQVLTPGISIAAEDTRPQLVPRRRPLITVGITEKLKTGCGNLYVTINEDAQGLFEVFAKLGKTGGCAAAQAEAISRLISLSLRSGINIDAILKQVRGIRCPSPHVASGRVILSCPDAIATAIERYIKRRDTGELEPALKTDEYISKSQTLDAFLEPEGSAADMVGICPDCGFVLFPEGGCVLCRSCGYTRCG